MGPTSATDAENDRTVDPELLSDDERDLLPDAPVRHRRRVSKWKLRRQKAKKYAKWAIAILVVREVVRGVSAVLIGCLSRQQSGCRAAAV